MSHALLRFDPSLAAWGVHENFDAADHFDPAITIENFVDSETKCLPGGDKPRRGSKPGHVKRTARYGNECMYAYLCMYLCVYLFVDALLGRQVGIVNQCTQVQNRAVHTNELQSVSF
jgi:hypothetical protein